MKRIGLILVLITAILLSGCFPVLEQMEKRPFIPDASRESDLEQIDDMIELRDYVLSQVKEGNLEFSFLYDGYEEIDPGLIAQMAGVCFVRVTQRGEEYDVELTQFPGDRIVDAYFNDDTSYLTEDEFLALEKAVEMVDTAKRLAEDNWDLERLIHDILAEHITYSDADIYYDDPEEQPRHLSVIGALLDGEANCQGYTDAFYTLASIAGFEVGRLSVETADDPHMVNTICLDDKWYIVDVTYDDSADEAISYHLFNAGLDMVGKEYFWSEEVEPHPVTPNSDNNAYYYRYDLVFTDMDDFAEYAAEAWAKDGTEIIYGMLLNEDDGNEFSDSLAEALEDMSVSYEFRIWYSSNGYDTFYTIVFS